MNLESIGKLLALLGLAVTLLGALLWLGGRLGLGSLPGDIRLGNESWGCYLPIATSLLISIALTLLLNLVWRWFK